LKEIEFVEGDEEGKDGRILLREDPQEITYEGSCEGEKALFSLGEPSLNIEEHREEVEHSGHGGHSLNDVGDRLGLDGMADEEEAREKGDGKGGRSVAFFQGRKVESEKEEPI
jgi:hypothetical protein